MKLRIYLKNNFTFLCIYLICFLIITIILFLFETHPLVKMFTIVFLILPFSITILIDYYKKSTFYNNFNFLLENLDQKYLILELLKKPSFLEGKLLYDYLYQINKSMLENISTYKKTSEDFIEYLEAWCHEIKTPLQTSKLLIENNKNSKNQSLLEELIKIEDYIDQVMYYSRSNTVEQDYLIKDTNLNQVVNNVLKKNKKIILSKKIKLTVNTPHHVYSDSKWLEFILNQIINNSLKYTTKNPSLNIITSQNKDNVTLKIIDNGIGIAKKDLPKVFNKSFTGENGRKGHNSTGLGLYLAKKLCLKLGHNIKIASILNKGTTVTIIFPKNSLTDSLTKM